MKKAIKALSFVITVIMTITAFSTVFAFAEGGSSTPVPTVPTVQDADKEERAYFFHQDFNNLTKSDINVSSSKADIQGAGGFWLCNQDNGEFVVENGYLKNMGTSYIDLQLYHLENYTARQDFVLSARMMPMSENINGQFIEFVRGDSTNQSAKTLKSLIKFVNGDVVVNGVNCGKMELNQWLLIEVAFNYNETTNFFDSYTVMLNGTAVGTADLLKDEGVSYNFTYLEHFRMFRNMTNYTYAVSEINITEGSSSILYAKAFNGTLSVGSSGPVIQLPVAPTVSDEEKEEREYLYHQDFNSMTTATVNASDKIKDIKAAKGFWLNKGEGENTYAIENGYLKQSGTKFTDLQLSHLNFEVEQDFVLSTRMLPLSEKITGWFINFIKDVYNDNKAFDIVKFHEGSIYVNNVDCGKLVINEWVLIEVAFHYNEDDELFDSYTVMLNGVAVGNGSISTEPGIENIDQYRLFYSMGNYTYAIDDINIIDGNKSILYAGAYIEAPDDDDDELDGGSGLDDLGGGSQNNGNNSTGSSSNSGSTNNGGETSDTTVETVAEGKKKGCSGFVSGGAIALVVALGAGTAVLFRRKED